jgi:hypothetical protein
MTFRGKGAKVRADGSVVNEDYLICDSYQRGRGCAHGYHFNYRLWEGGILDAILLEAMGDRHFSSPEAVRMLEIDLADRVRTRAADSAKAERALTLAIDNQRPEAEARWLALTSAVDEHDAAIRELQRELVDARGAVSPEEHRRRIFALRGTLDDEDEQVRFVTRSRVMEAVHELIGTMSFSASPLCISMTMTNGAEAEVHWEEWGDAANQKGTAWSISMPTAD